MGKQDNIADILYASDVIVLPSENESFGLAALEALACGVPCVTSNAGGLSEVNLDNETGFTIDVGDTKAFANAIEKLIDDKSLRTKFSQNAKAISRDKFSSDQIVPKYINYYEKVLSG